MFNNSSEGLSHRVERSQDKHPAGQTKTDEGGSRCKEAPPPSPQEASSTKSDVQSRPAKSYVDICIFHSSLSMYRYR